jgi:hypothetical protein
MYLQISCLDIMENLTDIVDRSLYGPDPPSGVWWIDLHWLKSWRLLARRTRGHLRELGPSGVVAIRT